MKKLGNYQKTVLKALQRDKSHSYKVTKSGYSRQVKSLMKRRLIRRKGDRIYLTPKGNRRVKTFYLKHLGL
jgi:predicted transcriptional regulator